MRVAVILAAAISLASAAVLPEDIDDVVDPPVGDEAADAASELLFQLPCPINLATTFDK